MVAGMLSAIQDFSRDSFKTGKDEALEEFRIGELQVWIAPGAHAYLAAAIRGNPPRELRASLEDAIERVHVLRGSALAKFNGDAAQLRIAPAGSWSRVCARNISRRRRPAGPTAPGLRSPLAPG